MSKCLPFITFLFCQMKILVMLHCSLAWYGAERHGTAGQGTARHGTEKSSTYKTETNKVEPWSKSNSTGSAQCGTT